MHIKEVLNEDDLAVLEILEDPLLFTEFINSKEDDIEDGEYGWYFNNYQRKMLVDTSNYISVCTGRATGKCSPAGTKILLGNGYYTNIEDLENKSFSVVSYNANLKQDIKEATCFVNGIKPCYKVKLGTGRETEVTINHPFYTVDGYKPLSELSIGDYVAIPSSLPYFGTNEVDDNEVKVIAYLLTDGCISGKTAKFTNAIPEVIDECRDIANYFCCDLVHDRKYDYYFGKKRGTGKYNKLLTLLKEQKLLGTNSHTKFIPNKYMQLNKNQISLLLSRMYACDGWVTDKEIGYCTVSKEMAYQVRSLLLKFGISANVSFKPKTKAYSVYVASKYDINKFRESISIFCKPISTVEKVNNNVYDIIPVDYKQYKTKEKNGWLRTLRYTPTRSKLYTCENLSEHDLNLIGSDLKWVKIVDIEPTGEKLTYGISVEDNKSYISDDILVHNTEAMQAKIVYYAVSNRFTKTSANEVLLVTQNKNQLEPVFNRIVRMFRSHHLLKYFVDRNSINMANHEIRLVTGCLIRARIVGSTADSNVIGMHTPCAFVDEAQVMNYTAWNCLDGDTLVATSVGTIPIEDVVNNRVEEVLTYNNSKLYTTKVKNWFSRNTDSVVKITTDNNSVVCTPEHKWWAANNNGFKFIETKDLKIGDKIRSVYVPKRVPHYPTVEEFLYGTLLGDGHIERLHTCARYKQVHSVTQESYARFKYGIVSELCTSKPTLSVNSGFGTCNISFNTVGSPRILDVYNTTYIGGVKTITMDWLKKLTPFSIAVWYMDDGSLWANRNISLATCCFSDNELDLIIEYFLSTYGIRFSKLHDKSLLCLDKVKFLDLVSPYVEDSMLYKTELVMFDTVQNIEETIGSFTVYDIEVEDSGHKFIANNLVSSNSLQQAINKWDVGFEVWVSGVPNGLREKNVLFECDQLDTNYSRHNLSRLQSPRYVRSQYEADLRQYGGENGDDFTHLICFPEDTPIVTNNGIVDIAKVSVGDYVLSKNGVYTLVTSVQENDYEGNLVGIKVFGDYRTYYSTPEHPILATKTSKCLNSGQSLDGRCWYACKSKCKNRLYEQYVTEFLPAASITKDYWLHYPETVITHNSSRRYVQNSLYTQRVREVTTKQFNGKVYNLTTEDGTYCLPSFIVHNCGEHGSPAFSVFDRKLMKIADYPVSVSTLNNVMMEAKDDKFYEIMQAPDLPSSITRYADLLVAAIDAGFSNDPTIITILWRHRDTLVWREVARYELRRIKYPMQAKIINWLDTIYGFNMITIDAGSSGLALCQILQDKDGEFGNKDFSKRVIPVDFQANVITGYDETGKEIKDRVRKFTIQTLQKWTQNDQIIEFSSQDDDVISELERVGFTRDMLGQPKYFVYSPQGGQKGEDHVLASILTWVYGYYNEYYSPDKPTKRGKYGDLAKGGWLK